MTERSDTMSPGRTLRCDEARILLMGYIDGELAVVDRQRTEDHLAVCVACRREEQVYRELGRVTAAVGRVDVAAADADAGVAWMRIYERLEGGLAYVLMWAGLALLGGYGLWQLGAGLLMDGEVPLIVRLGIGTLTAGALLLLISFIRDRVRRHRSERYREVER